ANQGGSVYAGMSAAIPEKKLKKLAHFRPEWWLTFVRNQWLSLVRNSQDESSSWNSLILDATK
ncbi:MAG: hypothetical protein ACK5Q9_09545, partial [Cyclobacteriaceae bacterium]